jgi:hypothetical protein
MITYLRKLKLTHSVGTRLIMLMILLLLSACAVPQVDHKAFGFDQETFQTDMSDCRGGTLLESSASSLGNVAVGSLWGAFHGAPAGAMAGDGWEGAAIGAVVGGIIGLGVGASEAIEQREQKIAGCLRRKGYVLALNILSTDDD